MIKAEKIICWKKDRVYFMTDNGLCGKTDLDESDETACALLPHMAYWEKWCAYDLVDVNWGEAPEALRNEVNKRLARLTPTYPIGQTEAGALEQKTRIEAWLKEITEKETKEDEDE